MTLFKAYNFKVRGGNIGFRLLLCKENDWNEYCTKAIYFTENERMFNPRVMVRDV